MLHLVIMFHVGVGLVIGLDDVNQVNSVWHATDATGRTVFAAAA